MEKKIDIILITGFLGAGKTTLLNKLVTSYSGQNIGLLVNDFGQIPVDSCLIQDSSTDLHNNSIYEISNGSIFCSCLTSSFVMGLNYFIQKAPDILFIETSGMSDPSSMARLLGEYKLLEAYKINHVLTVVDAANVLKIRSNMTFIDRQIDSANTILVNKSDLVSDVFKEKLKSVISGINDSAEVIFTSYCDFNYKTLVEKSFRPEGNAQSCNTKASAPKTMLLPQHDVGETSFLTLIGSLVEMTLRIKGYYSFNNREFYISNNNGLIEAVPSEKGNNHNKGITLIYEGKYHEEINSKWQDFKVEHSL